MHVQAQIQNSEDRNHHEYFYYYHRFGRSINHFISRVRTQKQHARLLLQCFFHYIEIYEYNNIPNMCTNILCPEHTAHNKTKKNNNNNALAIIIIKQNQKHTFKKKKRESQKKKKKLRVHTSIYLWAVATTHANLLILVQ